MFLTWLDNPEESYDHYRRNGGDTTINSILGRPLDAPVDGVEDASVLRLKQQTWSNLFVKCHLW